MLALELVRYSKYVLTEYPLILEIIIHILLYPYLFLVVLLHILFKYREFNYY